MNSTLTMIDFAALSPLLILLLGSSIVLLVESFAEKFARTFSFYMTSATILLALYCTFVAPASTNSLITPWLRFDQFAFFFSVFFLVIGFASTLLSHTYFTKFNISNGEYYFLFLSALIGLILISSAADFLTLFLGLETLSISLYILCGYIKKWKTSNEASIKYFFMGALATGFLLYGVALVYGAIGTTNFDHLLESYNAIGNDSQKLLFLVGIMLITLGLFFKAAIVPFHAWAPDVYGGAPTPITAFMAVGTKAAAFAALARIFLIGLPQFNIAWNEAVTVLAYITLIYANFVAMRQTQLRRFFAYSGISHAGFLLIPLIASTPDSLQALLFYLVIYALATLGSFAILVMMDKGSEGVTLNDLKGLFKQSPLAAFSLAICFLTLAGIPPTAGFFAKFFLFKVAFEAGYYPLVIVALLTTILSAYYYLRFISYLFATSEKHAPLQRTWSSECVAYAATLGIIILSIYPAFILKIS